MDWPSAPERDCPTDRSRAAAWRGAATRIAVAVRRRVPADWRERIDRFATKVICCGLATMMAAWPVRAQQANVIITDGRTQTQVQSQGNVTNITTSTVSGANGFNSFSQFGVGRGNTVNLQLPNGTQNLINIVRDAPAYVNGTLNSYKNGQIGGNVYFADPYGFVVGRSGVVNVGSLNVSTPTREFVDSVISPSGQINDAAVANLLAGTVPISPNGNIRIRGKVNAVDAVRLTGQNVFVGSRSTANREQATRFASTVNSRGLRSANGIVVRNGSIQIVAANDAKVNARMSARRGSVSVNAAHNVEIGNKANISVAAKNGQGGSIAVNAGQDIKVAGYGVLSAKSANGNAGTIRLIADRDLIVEPGATFDASSTVGNGGIVELSAFGRLNIPSGVKVNIGAPNGTAGYLLIDPATMTISDNPIDIGGSGNYTSSDVTGWVNSVDAGGTLILCAGSGGGNCNGTFTLESGTTIDGRRTATGGGVVSISISAATITINGTIDTRSYAGALATDVLSASSKVSTGNSGSVTLTAPSITIGSGGKIFADVNNNGTSYTGGTVSMVATKSDYKAIGVASATAEININGTIAARSISAAATATAQSVYALNSNNTSPGDMATVIGGTLLLNLLPLGLTPGYVQSEANATVNVGGTAHLIAQNDSTGSISLTARTTTVSSDPALGLSNGSFLAGSVVVGSVRNNATVNIANGANISGGGALTVAAVNSATVDIKSATISGIFGQQGAVVVFSVAYADADVNAAATIASGATIAMSGTGSSVNVLARNDNSFGVAANSYARNGGAAGTALAISDFNSSAVAHVGADIGSATNKVGNVTILAQDETSKNQTSASATAGAGAFADALTALSTVGSAVGQGVQGGGVSPPNAGLLANLFGFTNFGQAMKLGGTTLPMFAGGVSLSYGTQTSSASVAADLDNNGNRIVATAPRIYASGNVAIGSDTTDAAFLNLATSAVNSPKNGTSLNPSASLAVSAGIAYSEITRNSAAYIGPDAIVNAAKVGVAANTALPSPIENINWKDFGSVLDGLLANKSIVTTGANATSGSTGLGIAGSMNYAIFDTNTTAWIGNGAQVTATSTNNNAWSANLGGLDPNSGAADIASNFTGPLSVLATTTRETINIAGNFGLLGGNVANGAAAVGASLGMLTDTANTYAGIGQGAIISSGAGVDVEANSFDRVVNASPVNGAGEGINISGLVDVFQLTDRTIASIGNKAQVTAASVTVNATETLGIYTIAGDISFSGSSGVGAAVTYNGINTTTKAFIGDNSTIAGTDVDPNQAVVPSAAGFVKTGALDVDAKTSGNVIAASLVSQVVDSSAPEPPPVPASSLSGQVLAAVQNTVTATISISLSGASAITDTAMDTEAYLDHVTTQRGTASNPYVQVQAVNNSLVVSGAGGAAITLAGRPRPTSGALSGAIAVASSSNTTLAYIQSSTVNIGSVAVEALTSGLSVVAGIGLSVDTSESELSATIAGSVSATKVRDRVAAYVDSSTISNAGSGNALVLADQSTMLGNGGGSFFFGGKGGFGLAVTYIDLRDPDAGPATEARISNSSVTGFTDVNVVAVSPQVIYAGAAAGGTSGTASIGGSFIFTTLDATTSATISNSGTTALAITANQNVNVVASTNPNDIPIDYNSVFHPNDNQGTTYRANYAADPNDTSASNQTAAALLQSSSAQIISVAGVMTAGEGSAVGIALINNAVGNSHVASISGVTVTAQNAVAVSAGDSTTITSIAAGIGASSDGFAFEGASVSNTITGGASATVGSLTGAPTTIGTGISGGLVGALAVSATNSSNITAIALNLSLSAEDPAAGVAISSNNIATDTAAAISNASVYTTYNSSGTFSTGDIVVQSQSSGEILAVAAGMAVSGENFSANGSVSTNLANGNVRSSVSNSTLYATNNIGVLAANDNAINAIAGAVAIGAETAGIGISVVTNVLGGTNTTGETFATVTNSTLDAAALGQSGLQVIDGKLVAGATQTSSAPDSPSNSVTPAAVANLGKDVRQVHGIAVNAGSRETAISTTVTLGVSEGAAVAVNVITTKMGGITKATVTNSALDTNLAAQAAPPAIDVSARSVTFTNNFDYAIAFGDKAGAAVAVTNLINRSTIASVTSTNVGVLTTVGGNTRTSAGAVTVQAYSWQGSSGVAVGGAGGMGSAAVAGSVATNLFQGTTSATIDHGTINAGSVSVKATGVNGFFAALGGGSLGMSAGVGATVLVATSSNTVSALVGDLDPTSAATVLNLTGALSIAAANTTNAISYAIVGAIGGSAGIAAQFSGMFVNNSVDAELRNASATMYGTAMNAAVSVQANETDSIAPTVGGIAGGGSFGAGAAVNLVSFKSNTKALMAGATVRGASTVNVSSNSIRDINPITLTAALSGQVALAATVGVVLVGSGATSDEMSVLNAGASSGDSSSGTLGNAGAVTQTDVVGGVGGGVDGISAQILNSDVTASSIGITAASQMATRNIAGSLSIGVAVGGIGAGVAYTTVSQTVTAQATGGSLTAPAISISASAGDHGSGKAVQTLGAAGAGGLYVGLGAAVGKSIINNTVLANLGATTSGGANGATTGTVAVTASDSSSISSYGYGGAGGIAAVGLSLAFANKTSHVTAQIADSTHVTSMANVAVMATAAGSVSAETIAGAAGVFSGAGSSANASDTETVLAQIGASANISAAGTGVLVYASGTPDVSTYSHGEAIGGVGIGVSSSISSASMTITADVGNSTTFSGGPLVVSAVAAVPSGDHSSYAHAISAGGGTLYGLQGSYAEANNTTTVLAYGGTGVTLPSADVSIGAQNDTDQYAEATGAAFGYVAAGATITLASSNGHTTAYLDTGVVTSANNTGSLSIVATGTDTNAAKSTAGSGGFSAGAAAVSTTSTTSTVDASLKGNANTTTATILYLGGLGVRAGHTTNYAATGDAFQASAIGASGGNAANTITSTVNAGVGANLVINSAGGDMNVIAADTVTKTGGGARAGSGGVAAGAATLSSSTVTQTVNTYIDSGTIFSLNDNPLTSLAKIHIGSFATLTAADTVSLTAGGLFAGGGATSTMTETATLGVRIDATELFSAGGIDIGSAAVLNASTAANANLYGLMTGAGASTSTVVTSHQSVSVAAGTRIEAWGPISIYAGQSNFAAASGGGGAFSQVTANATTVVYNYALIPINPTYDGNAEAYSYATLTLGAGSLVLGANNVFLGATQGGMSAQGKGTSYNPYLTLFSTENHSDRSISNADANNVAGIGDVVINGRVVAGIHNSNTIVIGVNGALTLDTGLSCQVQSTCWNLTLEQVSDPSQFNPVMSYNHQTIQYSLTGGFSPYQDVLGQIAALSGLSTTQVDAAISGHQTITAVNDDTAGTKQRQIDTLIQQAPFASRGSGQVYAFNNILASAGNVSILAKNLYGTNGSVTANGSPLISIDNQGIKFLALNALTVTAVTGGNVNFTGSAGESQSLGITYRRDTTGTQPLIRVSASYNTIDTNTGLPVYNGQPLATPPDIYFNGAVTVVNGLLSITDLLGSVVATKSLTPLAMEMYVPKGAFTFNGGANSIYNLSGDVASQWDSQEFRPTDTLTAVEAAATWLGTYGSVYMGGDGTKHPYQYFYSNSGDTFQNSVVTNYSNADTIFTARMLSLSYGGGSLWSAIFLPTNGLTGNYNTIENTSQSLVFAPWERHNYEDQAYGDGGHGGPFNCSGCGSYFQVIHLQPYALQPKTAQSTTTPASSLNFGKALIISADVININGTATVGQTSNYSVNIGDTARDTINNILSHSDQLASARQNAAAGKLVDLSGVVSTSASGDVKIGAQYNALTNQIVLSSVVQGTGGYVYLNGKIISTSTSGSSQGNIIVNGGAGTVNVVNTSGFDLVTNTINTGVTAASVVQIVDHLKNQTTWYVYNAGASAGQQVTTYQANNITTSAYTSSNVSIVGQSGPSGLEYDPAANMYYQWVDTATLTRPSNTQSNQYNWTFANTGATGLNGWTRSAGTLVANVQSVSNGQATGSLQGDNFQSVMTASGSYYLNSFSTGDKCCGTDFSGTWNQEIYTSVTLTLTNTVKASFPIGISFNGGGLSTVNVNSNSSIVLNGPINNLQGTTRLDATGANSSITVASGAANAVVTGTTVTLNGQGGVGTAANPIPVQVYGGTLTASSTDRDIAVRAAGPLSVNRVTVNTAYSNASTGRPEPRGDVYLTASGDITSAQAYNASSPIIVARSIELDSTAGAVGASLVSDGQGGTTLSANPIVLQTWATTFDNGATDGGLLSSTSATGTYIVQPQGDVRLGHLIAPPANTIVPAVSSQGPVLIAALNGNILNGITSGGLSTAQQQYLEGVWASLGLVNGSGGQAVASYESMVNAAYNDYWQLRNLAFADGVTYSISTLGTAAIGAQLIAAGTLATGTDLNSADAQAAIRAEVFKRYNRDQYLLGLKTAAQLGGTVEDIVGSQVAASLDTLKQKFNATRDAAHQVDDPYAQIIATSALTAALAPGGYNSAFSYTIDQSSVLYASLTSGSQWSLDQLRYTVGQGATGAPPSIADMPINVSGRQVMLYAPNGSIGSLAPDDVFSFTSASASNLTDAQKGLLATAGPGQLSVATSVDPNTHITTYTITVKQQSLVIVSPRGPVAAKALNDIYLGSVSDGQDSAGDMLLGGIGASLFGPVSGAASAGVQTTASGGGQVQLHAVGSIIGGVAGQVAISGNIANLTLTADNGSIGRSGSAALRLALTGATIGQVDDAVAAQGIYLNQTTGDLVLGRVMAGQGSSAIELTASGSIYQLASFTDPTQFHISGSSLNVSAGGNVGFNGATLQALQVKITGAITGSAVGALEILSPQSDMVIGSAGGTLTSGGALTLSTIAGSINLNNDINSIGALTLLANAAVNFSAGTSLDPVTAKSSGGAITVVAATLAMGNYSVLDAAGVLSVTTTGNATLGQLRSAASYAAAGNAASIIVNAGGVTTAAILSNGDAQTDLVTTGTGAVVSLRANNIGTASQRVAVSSQALAATATDGSIYLTAAPDMRATLLSAVEGTVDVTGAGSYTLDSVLASTSAGATGHFIAKTTGAGTLTVGTATGRGTVRLLAADNVSFGSLTSLVLAGDPGDVSVTTGEGAILGGSITAYGGVTLTAGANLPVGSPLAANAKIISTGSIASSTLIALSARGDIDWQTLNAATTIDVTSTDGGARVGTATTVGSITMHAKQDVAFDQLTNTAPPGQGDVTLTSDNGAIIGGSITSNGSVSLIAAGSITATGAAGNGGTLNWSVLRAGGSMFLHSLGDAITIDVATSGGGLTLWARNNVTFRQVSTTGSGSNIVLRSDEGAIIALGTGLVNVDASGSATMNAATSITGGEVRAGGSVAMTATNGQIGWNAVTAGTTVDVRSSADAIDIATILSGGTQSLWAERNVTFTQLTATAGGADITSNNGAIVGGSVALGGATRMLAKTTISGTTATSIAGAMDMSAEEMITWNAVNAAGGSLTITSTRETMNIPSLSSGGKMTLDVAQDMAITQITTTGIPGDAGDVEVTSHTGRITGGTIAANGGVALNAPISITGVSATGATGAVSMNTNGLIDWTAVTAGTTVNARSTADSVNFGTVTSGGTQTIRAAQNVNFGTLTTNGITGGDVGDVGVAADAGFIQGTTVAANGSVSLVAATTNKGTTLGATVGSVSLAASGLIEWATITAGTTVNARSTADSIDFGTVTSGGTQTIRAASNVDFDRLTTNGIAGDAGSVGVTADTGYIQGTTVAANGSASLTAATTNKGTTLGATTGSVALAASGVIDWTTVTAGKTVNARSTADSINFASVTSGGTQTIHADQNVTFQQLTTTGIPGDLGDIIVTADHGSINGSAVSANGDASFVSGQSINVSTMRAGSATLSTPYNLSIGMLSVYRAMTLGADIIHVTAEQLASVPPVPLHVVVTGYRGGVATYANLNIDPPQVIVDRFSVVDSAVTVDSPSLTVVAGYVPGQMLLNTPAGQILLNNRGPGPVGGNNLQLYQPGGVFTMQQIGNANFSNTQVVYYDTTISSTIINYGGGDFTGSAFVRNAPRDMRNGDMGDVEGLERTALMALYLRGVAEGRIGRGPIEVIGEGPAVNVDGLLPTGEKRKLRKGYRTNLRSSAVENRGLVSFASAAYGR
ncbi:leukotoxin LktA family filamentous adhesin [Pseudolabrys sp. Root1462]|uniref:leukotoxin LktA family filamentous adhesin n=1 Tax=Pseudolabrys sp. Root1462 TaxID=1736466 RepID=UPI0009E9309A|nr:leukotoxin LktA family filamentous adhesin [Pseudolabrys sp. Root1462]